MKPLDIKTLLPELRSLVADLSEDLLARVNADGAICGRLKEAFGRIKKSGRTGQPFEVWLEDYLDQVAVAWVLACVFVRFIEDNGLLDECWIAGEGNRKNLADGHYEIYFRQHPRHTDRDFLKYVFKEVGKIPAAKELFEEGKTPLWAVDPSGDASRRLLNYFKEIDSEKGGLKRSFATKKAQTQPIVEVYQKLAPQAQFLGDLYQDLSEHARKKYALLQTPEFIQNFLLDRTLTRAIDTFGLKNLRLIDPTCGSGHLLLGAFDRLFTEWMKPEYGVNNPVVAAQNALDSIFGVDLNPFAVAITRFRLLVAAIQACNINRLHQQSYAWKLNLATGDSLLNGSKPSPDGSRAVILQQSELFEPDSILAIEQSADARRILNQGYHVVVGNPPYITPKDKALNERYRTLYSACHMKYSLAVPFSQRFFELALRQGEQVISDSELRSPAPGYVGMITANSFMKREFGKKLIESFFTQVDLTHVIDTSGAYIPGHGTPTVILLGRPRKPVDQTVRTAMGIIGEPSTPADPAHGLVWSSIVTLIDRPGEQNKFISIADTARESFARHPWSIGGGGATELKELLDESSSRRLSELRDSIGITSFTLEDDLFILPRAAAKTRGLPAAQLRPMVLGDSVRDWMVAENDVAVFPYDQNFAPIVERSDDPILRYLWIGRTGLSNNMMFGGKTKVQSGLRWYEFGRLTSDKLRTPLSIVFGFVATHNHFVLDRGGKVFKQSAPVVKLPATATIADHLGLLGLLNSSTACFWLKQVSHNKGSTVDQHGARQRTAAFEDFWEFTATQLESFPLPVAQPLLLAEELDRLAGAYADSLPSAICSLGVPSIEKLESARQRAATIRSQMIGLQEELDWQCYRLYGLTDDTELELPPTGWDAVAFSPQANGTGVSKTLFSPKSSAPANKSAAPELRPQSLAELPPVDLGQRAFEIVLARQATSAEIETTWFSRHGSTPITEMPKSWPTAYRNVVQKRIEKIESDKAIALIEKPEYKRRWNTECWEDMQEQALRKWLLDRLETPRYRRGKANQGELSTTAQMADVAATDSEFMQVATVYRGRADFDVASLVAELVGVESVPLLPVLRYKSTGLRKRALWERTWDLQRQQDAGKAVGPIDVPPKYVGADFLNTDYWRLRGKLDVPKERWVSYPHCSTDGDQSLLVAWAGWSHLEQAAALVSYYDARKREGWDAKRLTPLLAGLLQLIPWIHQWHPEVDPEFGETAGQSFQHMLEADAHELGLTMDDIRNWTPPAKTKAVRRKKETA